MTRGRVVVALTIASTLTLTPQPAAAQTAAALPRVVTLGSEPTEVWDAFERRLNELGYVDGRTVRLDRRWSHGLSERVPALVAEALATNPDVAVASILPPNTGAASARCVPFLAIGVAEPYGACPIFPVVDLSPAASAREVSEMHVRLAVAAVPSATRMTVLTDASRPFLVHYVAGLRRAAEAHGVSLTLLDVSREPDRDGLVASLARQAPDALIVAPSFGQPHARRQMVLSASRMRIPTIGAHLMDGVVVAADYDWRELARRAASFVDRVLRGSPVSELDRRAPAKFEVVVDRRAADAVGLVLPESLVQRADRVLD